MTSSSPNGRRRGWEYPPCPSCGSHILTDYDRGFNDLSRCWGCGKRFETPEGDR